MQVDFLNLEPGMVVETPKELVGAAKEPLVIYSGTYSTMPFFREYADGTWKAVYWPNRPGPYYNEPWVARWVPLPSGFKVATDNELAKRFVNDWLKKDTIKVGMTYASGCDPEIFVMDSAGKVIPARKVLPKKSQNNATFFDGLQAEFCPGPGTCLEALGSRIRNMLLKLKTDFNVQYKAKLSIQNSILLTQEEMDKLDDEDVAFRCSESMNIYNDIPAAQEPREYLWRFAGGHIHVGVGTKPVSIMHSIVRAMDGILGVASVSMARSFDTPERRKSYGRAGEFRLPGHGLEYRVLSNFWLCSPLIYHLTFEIARWAYRLGENGLFQAWEGSTEEIRECINNCDVSLAQKLIKRNAGIYNKLFKERWGQSLAPNRQMLIQKAMDTIMNGLEVVVKDPTDVERNWYLHDSAQWGLYGEIANGKWRQLQCS